MISFLHPQVIELVTAHTESKILTCKGDMITHVVTFEKIKILIFINTEIIIITSSAAYNYCCTVFMLRLSFWLSKLTTILGICFFMLSLEQNFMLRNVYNLRVFEFDVFWASIRFKNNYRLSFFGTLFTPMRSSIVTIENLPTYMLHSRISEIGLI